MTSENETHIFLWRNKRKNQNMIKMTKARAAALFDALDADGSGEIDDEEFIEGQKFPF